MLENLLRQMLDEAERNGRSLRVLQRGLRILVLNMTSDHVLIISRPRTYPSFDEWHAVVRAWPHYVREPDPVMALYEQRPSLQGRLPKEGIHQLAMPPLFQPTRH
jgi:hypothetical protein